MNTIHDPVPSAPTGAPDAGPVRRVVLASLATGMIGAAALTLGALGGAPEHVISGSALLAFASGWAMLFLLSRRFTPTAQRWALVPAAWMGTAGAVLLAARPGDRALDLGGWIWPPLALALAWWMLGRIRAGFDGRVRWLLYPVAASLAVVSVGATAETAIRARDRGEHAAPGERYDVGGHRLHLYCRGSGQPTVVLEGGLGAISVGWTRVMDGLAGTTRVCAYDRAGQGWSDDVSSPHDGLEIAEDLHALLGTAGETGPYVLVGHSAGGPYVLNFASRHPDEVAGVVLLDSMSPDEFTDLPGFASEQSMMRRGLGVMPSLSRLGAGRIVPASMWSNLPEPAASQLRAFAASARGMRNLRDEQSMYRTVFAQAKALASLGDRPLVVVAATESLDAHEEWSALQQRLAGLSSVHALHVADSSHAGLLDDADGAAVSAAAVRDVVASVRTTQPLRTP